MKQCRLCEAELPALPAYTLNNVPCGVQYLPLANSLAEDQGIVLEVHECPSCRLVQLGGAQVIYETSGTSATSSSSTLLRYRENQANDMVKRFELSNKRVFDIGCGDGYFLKILNKLGVLSCGIDPSLENVRKGQLENLDIRHGLIGETSIAPPSFDAFTCFHVLEHVAKPVSFLKEIHTHLKPGAVGLIEVPSFTGMYQHASYLDFFVDHVSYFTEATLRHALHLGGFEVVDFQHGWGGAHLIAFVRRAEPVDFGVFSHSAIAQQRIFRDFIELNTAKGLKICLWGASHEANTLLALSGADGIEYVIDSARFKHGRFTPVSHVPIVPPDTLRHQPVDVVLIATQAYETEIARDLKDIYTFPGKVFSLRERSIEALHAEN